MNIDEGGDGAKFKKGAWPSTYISLRWGGGGAKVKVKGQDI